MRDCATLEEQRGVYKRYAGRIALLSQLLNATRRVWCPLIAVPANQLHLFTGNVVRIAAENLFLNTHIAGDNYFYHGYLYGCYTERCCPRYLKRENWDALQGAVGRIDVRTGTLKDVAARYPDGFFSRYILLDHMDWMPMSMILDEWAVFVAKASPDVRFLWRSFADHQHIAPLKYLHFHEENVRAALAMFPDRVAMYNSTHLATLPGDMVVTPRSGYAPRATVCDDANVLFHNWLHPISGADHQARLESFYKGQAQSYDGFRHRFLHGRLPMIEAMPTTAGATWVDLGGGTAANLEHFAPPAGSSDSEVADLSTIFSKVMVVDLCRPLIEVARARVEAHGWGKTVELVVGDVTDPTLPGLPPAGSVDLVTMSYSLTMIPDWQAALKNVSAAQRRVGVRRGAARARSPEAVQITAPHPPLPIPCGPPATPHAGVPPTEAGGPLRHQRLHGVPGAPRVAHAHLLARGAGNRRRAAQPRPHPHAAGHVQGGALHRAGGRLPLRAAAQGALHGVDRAEARVRRRREGGARAAGTTRGRTAARRQRQSAGRGRGSPPSRAAPIDLPFEPLLTEEGGEGDHTCARVCAQTSCSAQLRAFE